VVVVKAELMLVVVLVLLVLVLVAQPIQPADPE
jgi:hypothetical protein